ncbi:MAG: poly(A) polymerase [Neolewinella sp.]
MIDAIHSSRAVSSLMMQVTRIELPPLPEPVQDCLQRLRDAGGRGWLVGGAVRDLLQGGNPDDFDLASDLPPEQLAKILPNAELREAALGTCRTTIDGCELTVTTLRAEGGYGDQRHPDTVEFVSDVAVDARRRDFTVNALYYDPDSSELLDPVGAQLDLQASVLRAIGEPMRRFQEDPLRLLRLARFAASANLQIEPATAHAAKACASEVASVSAERVYAELTKAFIGPGRGRALGLLVELGLADVLLPEISAMEGVEQPPQYHPEGDVLVHVKMVLDEVPANDPVLAWSAVLHDVGKPPTFRVAEDRIRFDGHDTLSAKMAEEILLRFKAPKALRKRVVDICLQHIRFAALPQMRPVRAERWLREPDFPLHLAFHRADCMASHGKLEIHAFAERALRELQPLVEPLLHGKDVLAMGVKPGRQVGQLLQSVQALLDESPVAPTRDQALVLLRDAVDRLHQGPDDCAR